MSLSRTFFRTLKQAAHREILPPGIHACQAIKKGAAQCRFPCNQVPARTYLQAAIAHPNQMYSQAMMSQPGQPLMRPGQGYQNMMGVGRPPAMTPYQLGLLQVRYYTFFPLKGGDSSGMEQSVELSFPKLCPQQRA